MDTPNPLTHRSDDVAFIKLVIEVERLTREVEYQGHLLYVPNGGFTLLKQLEIVQQEMLMLKRQMDDVLIRQRWLQGIGGAIVAGLVVQIAQWFFRKGIP